jgi:hypothetical protein
MRNVLGRCDIPVLIRMNFKTGICRFCYFSGVYKINFGQSLASFCLNNPPTTQHGRGHGHGLLLSVSKSLSMPISVSASMSMSVPHVSVVSLSVSISIQHGSGHGCGHGHGHGQILIKKQCRV